MPTVGKPLNVLQPFWQTSDNRTVRLYHGDVLAVLKRMPSQSVHMVVTSPPYWGLRDYGTAEWEGGDAGCDHKSPAIPSNMLDRGASTLGGGIATQNNSKLVNGYKDICGKCGAKRIDQQIGSEDTPEEFVAKMVEVFREVRRVLRDDGTCWLNLGDTYGGGPPGGHSDKQSTNQGSYGASKGNGGLKSGNLVGIPWRVALALQADGWILRSDIPWVKRSPMPESVKNRPAKALEYVFMFSKRMGYFYDGEAIKKIATPAERLITGKSGSSGQAAGMGRAPSGNGVPGSVMKTGDKRNFWQADLWFESVDTPHGLTRLGDEIVGMDVTSGGYSGSHFATFPGRLIEPFILAGTSEYGCCVDCGAPWRRVVEEKQLKRERPNDYVKRTGEEGTGNTCANSVAGVETKTVGWEPTCECYGGGVADYSKDYGESSREYNVKPAIVLDPFIGSGTTCCVSIANGRHSVGIDLSEKYLRENAVPRIEGELFGRPSLKHLAGRSTAKVEIGRKVS